MTQQTISLENDHIELSVEKQPKCKVVFTITTKPLATKAAHAAALKRVSKELNIPGFRKGHAPAALITQQFKPQLEQEFRDVLARNALHEATKLSTIYPFSTEKPFNLVKCDPVNADSYNIVVEFEAFPEVPSIDPSTLDIESIPPKPVTEEEIQKKIDELKTHHGKWETIDSRPAQEGDFVTLNIRNVDENQTVHEGSRFHLTDGQIPNWAKNLVTGLALEGSAVGISELSEGETPENFKPQNYEFTVKKIEQVTPHPLDEELAKKAGTESVELLREAIEKSIQRGRENEAQHKIRELLKTKILENCPFELPAQVLRDLHQQCHEFVEADETKATASEKEDHAHELLARSEKNTRLGYLLSRAYRDFHLTPPSEAQVKQRATEMMMMRYFSGDTNLTELDLKHFTQTAHDQLYVETVLDFLIEKSKSKV